MPIEFINSLNPNGLPPYRLILKIGAIVVLLRNLDENLYNGTRLQIVKLMKYCIYVKIITGKKIGTIVCIPRMQFTPTNEELPFTMVRRQFPLKLGFAMTINKAQGQSFDKVGIVLSSPVFGHGQLYVALSRERNKEFIKLLIKHNNIYKDIINKKK